MQYSKQSLLPYAIVAYPVGLYDDDQHHGHDTGVSVAPLSLGQPLVVGRYSTQVGCIPTTLVVHKPLELVDRKRRVDNNLPTEKVK